MKKDKRLMQFNQAHARLEEALAVPLSQPLALDGTIQRFGFTFELAWKTLKAFLEDQGIQCQSPKGCLKEAFRLGWIAVDDEEKWLALLQARNMTAHVYNEDMAREIYQTIKKHACLFTQLLKVLPLEK